MAEVIEIVKIGIAIFSYIRYAHLNKTLASLKNNTICPDKLFLFHDGLKDSKNKIDWDNVSDLLKCLDWCDKEIIESKKNKGLSNSITYGIDYVLKECDAVIVLEDDCICSSDFLSFMYVCLEKYKENQLVYGVSGLAWPYVDKENDEYDIYFTGRISSWGWGTWKDRWQKYRQDNNVLNRIRNDKEKSWWLGVWGSDLYRMLNDRINNLNDSWAVYWALQTIEDGGVYISPYKPMIQNIGLDGTGTNCKETNIYDVKLNNFNTNFQLPDDILIRKQTIEAFVKLFGGYTALNSDKRKNMAIVYGLGWFFNQHEKELNEKYWICAVIDKAYKGYFDGKTVIENSDLIHYKNIPIIIMIKDEVIAESIKNELSNWVNESQLILFGNKMFV